mmetsp:Transcript_9911/g.27756  ORF Transcript_9911/g.27756 Transcript_9911/m.27756 type:complete len:281 (+) Transcript_9911:1276-2118(+)
MLSTQPTASSLLLVLFIGHIRKCRLSIATKVQPSQLIRFIKFIRAPNRLSFVHSKGLIYEANDRPSELLKHGACEGLLAPLADQSSTNATFMEQLVEHVHSLLRGTIYHHTANDAKVQVAWLETGSCQRVGVPICDVVLNETKAELLCTRPPCLANIHTDQFEVNCRAFYLEEKSGSQQLVSRSTANSGNPDSSRPPLVNAIECTNRMCSFQQRPYFRKSLYGLHPEIHALQSWVAVLFRAPRDALGPKGGLMCIQSPAYSHDNVGRVCFGIVISFTIVG